MLTDDAHMIQLCNEYDISFSFDLKKNAELKEYRQVSFEDVIESIYNDKILDIVPHHNKLKYAEQWIIVIELNDYAYQVPFKYEEHSIRLITIFPSRTCTEKYLRGEKQWLSEKRLTFN
jgi:uncharacterized DUF497 family protein